MHSLRRTRFPTAVCDLAFLPFTLLRIFYFEFFFSSLFSVWWCIRLCLRCVLFAVFVCCSLFCRPNIYFFLFCLLVVSSWLLVIFGALNAGAFSSFRFSSLFLISSVLNEHTYVSYFRTLISFSRPFYIHMYYPAGAVALLFLSYVFCFT